MVTARALRSRKPEFEASGRLQAMRTMLAQFASHEVAELPVELEVRHPGGELSPPGHHRRGRLRPFRHPAGARMGGCRAYPMGSCRLPLDKSRGRTMRRRACADPGSRRRAGRDLGHRRYHHRDWDYWQYPRGGAQLEAGAAADARPAAAGARCRRLLFRSGRRIRAVGRGASGRPAERHAPSVFLRVVQPVEPVLLSGGIHEDPRSAAGADPHEGLGPQSRNVRQRQPRNTQNRGNRAGDRHVRGHALRPDRR